MADLPVTPARVRILEVIESRLLPMIADEAILKGQPVYRKINGRAGVARANAVATAKVIGIASRDCAIGEAFEAQHYGGATGYDLSAVNPGTTIYLSTSAGGKLADAAATGTGAGVVPIGSVQVLTDPGQTRYIFVDISLSAPTPTAL